MAHLIDDSPEAREEAAETVTNWETSMSDFERRILVRVLSLLARSEPADRVREAQLNAITNVFIPPYMTEADVAHLFEMPAGALNKQDLDYLDGIREALDAFSETTSS